MANSGNIIERKGKRRNLSGLPRIFAFVIGFLLTSITFYTAFQGVFLPMIQRGIHLSLLVALIFLWYPASNNSPKEKPSIIDLICSFISIVILFWTILNHDRFLLRMPYYSDMQFLDILFGIILVLLVLEAGRRTLGIIITGLASFFILYGFLGPYMPGMFAHPGMSLHKFIDQMYLSSEGLLSSLVGISATLLFAFISFGTFLQGTKADKFYMDISLALTGKKSGGPAKVAILSSAAMGTISGSTIANVVTTGTLTIPLMKKTGYMPNEAGAIETAASAAGQIMPPIMGTGAFIMAEILGIRYIEIVKVAIIPAIIFYATVWFLVDIKARKRNIKGLNEEEVPSLANAIKKGFPLFFPIFVLIFLLLKNYTPFFSGSISTLLILFIAMLRKETRLTIKKIALTVERCAINMTSIAGIIACAAIIVSIINMTGLMIKTTSIILHLSGGFLMPAILLVAAMSYLLGMGLPIATSYIILSTLGAPSLMELGVLPIAAHLMIFWFSQLATITPPVCMTAYVAAGIAGADPMKTGFSALKFGSPFYFVPMLFIFTNILNGTILEIIIIGLLAIGGTFFLAAGYESYFFGPLNIFKRILCFIVFLLLFLCRFNIFIYSNIDSILLIMGILIAILLYISQKRKTT